MRALGGRWRGTGWSDGESTGGKTVMALGERGYGRGEDGEGMLDLLRHWDVS